MKKLIYGALASLSTLLIALAVPLSAKAATTVTVTPANDDGWSTNGTTAGGSVQYVNDPNSPLPTGALQLSTDSTNSAKATYMHTAGTALGDVTTLSYSTYQQTASSATGDPSYQLAVCLAGYNNNTCDGFTTLVYEPYWNTTSQTVEANTWQTWDAYSGQWWSSSTTSDPANTGCSVTAGHGGSPFYSLADLSTACPNAMVVGFGVNVGTFNPSYVTEVDGIVFNSYTYDFELTNVPSSKDDCKNNGYQTMTDQNGNGFKNQGLCVSYFNTGKVPQHMTLASVQVTNKDKNAKYVVNSSNQGQVQGANTTNNQSQSNTNDQTPQSVNNGTSPSGAGGNL